MKRILFAVLAVCLVAGAYSQKRLNVATFNIRYNNSNDSLNGNIWSERGPVICDMVRYHDFDVFGAQEVLHSQIGFLMSRLADYSYVGVGREDGKTKGEYAPIIYKKDMFNLLDWGTLWLSENTTMPNVGWDAALERICTWAKFKDNTTGKVFWFFNTHFDHVGVLARIESAKLILQKVKSIAGDEAAILTGDFNVDQNDESYALLANSGVLKDSYQATEIRYANNGTFTGFKPSCKTESRIDHIFVTAPTRVLRYGILTDVYWSRTEDSDKAIAPGDFPKELSTYNYSLKTPSDHFPVAVQLVLH